jgi:hypothetical protein
VVRPTDLEIAGLLAIWALAFVLDIVSAIRASDHKAARYQGRRRRPRRPVAAR